MESLAYRAVPITDGGTDLLIKCDESVTHPVVVAFTRRGKPAFSLLFLFSFAVIDACHHDRYALRSY